MIRAQHVKLTQDSNQVPLPYNYPNVFDSSFVLTFDFLFS